MGYITGAGKQQGGSYVTGGRPLAPAQPDPDTIASGELPYTEKLQSNAKSLAQQIHRLNAVGKEDDAMKLIVANQGAFSDDDIKAYGLDKLNPFQRMKLKKDDSFTSKIGHSISGGTQTGLSALMTGLDYSRAAGVGGVRQLHGYTARALDAAPGVEVQGAGKTKVGLGQFFTDVKDRTGFGELWEETKQGAEAEGDTSLFGSEAAQNNKWVDRAVGGVGDIAFDPLTYVGGAGLAKASLKGIARDLGEDLATKIGKEGLKNAARKGIITEAERRSVYEWSLQQGRKTVSQEAKGRKVQKLIDKVGEESAARQIGEETASAVERGARSGLRVRGTTVLPSSVLPGAERRAFQEAPALLRLIDDAPASEVIDDFNIKATTRAAEQMTPGAAVPASTTSQTLSGAEAVGNVAIERASDAPEFVPGLRLYHGTSSRFSGDKLASGAGRSTDNLLGPGLYLTDNPEVAASYLSKGKAKAPTVYAAQWLDETPPKLFDAEAAAPAEIKDKIRQSLEAITNASDLELYDDDLAAALHALDNDAPVTEVYAKIKAALGGNRKSTVDEIIDGLNQGFKDAGFDGLTYKGGIRAGKKSGVTHTAYVIFDDPAYTQGGNLYPGSYDKLRISSLASEGDQVAAVQASVPGTPGSHVIDMGDGEKLYALRGPDGKLLSYATVEAAETAPRVNLLHSVVGGQGNAQKVLKAVQESGISITDVIRNSEFTDEGRKAFKRFVQENIGADVTRRSAADALRQTGTGKALRRAFVPRSEVTDALGRGASDTLYEAQSAAAAAVGQGTHNVATQLSKLPAAAAKEFKDGVGLSLADVVPEVAGQSGKEALNTVALSAIEGRTLWDDVIGAARQDGMEKTANALEAFKDVVRQGDEALGVSETVLPRVVSREGAEALKAGDKNLELQEIFGISRDQAAELRFGSDLTDSAAAFEKRQLTPADVRTADAPDVRMAVKDLNTEISRRLKLPEGTKFFEDDAVSAVALRSRSAFEASAQTQMLQKLATGDNALVSLARAEDPTEAALVADRARKNGWDKLTPAPPWGDVYGPPEVIKELKNVQAVITNDASMRALQKKIQKVNTIWATYATSPILTGTAFHARNAAGNIINNFLRGLQDPRYYTTAVSRQRQLGKVRSLMKNEGVSWGDALTRAVPKAQDRAMLTAMKDNNVFSAGFFADLTVDDLDRLTSAKAPLKEKIGRAVTDNPATRSGRKLGDVVENNARMAHFEWAMDKYKGDITAATRSVKETLFDYADLTDFERNTMRSLNRFYTFQRKNLALQFRVLAENPWRTKAIIRGKDSLTRDDPNAPIPDYARKSGYGVADFLGVPKGTEGVAFTYDTPIDAATKTLDPLARAASMLPGIRSVLPPEYRSNAQDLTRSVLNMRTGGQVEMVNFLYETATGKDLYSGKDLTGENANTLNRLATTFMPLYGKAQGLAKREPGETAELTLLQALVGFQTIPLTDKQRNQIAYVGAQEAENAISRLKEQGVDVPSYSDLVRVGLAPDLSAPKDPNAKRRSSEQVYEDTLSQINSSRQTLGAPSVEGTPQQTGRKRTGGYFS